MSVSARRVRVEHEQHPQRPPAPVVSMRRPRRPPPEVIRRRRIFAVCGLLSGVVLVALLLGAVGGSSSRERIAHLLTVGSTAPATLCDHLSTGMAAAIGGHAGCLEAAPKHGPAARVHGVAVRGATATAIVSSQDGDERYRLVRQDGDWKVDDVR